MFKKVTETIVAGAVGILALYVVGRLGYRAGREITREEYRYNVLRQMNYDNKKPISVNGDVNEQNEKETDTVSSPPLLHPTSPKKQSKVGLLFRGKKLFSNQKSVIGDLMQNPEDHRFEAFIEDDELHIRVRKKEV